MLRQRGETPVEIAGMVRAMLKQRFPVNVRTHIDKPGMHAFLLCPCARAVGGGRGDGDERPCPID